jgi:cell division transport system permease protein
LVTPPPRSYPSEPRRELQPAHHGAAAHSAAPIIPAGSIAGRALLAVIAIMTFLAALTLGAVVLVRTAANEWQGQVAREMTIQVHPADGRDIEADVTRAVEIAVGTPGIANVRPYTREQSAQLLEPWLGGLSLAELPVPRLIVVGVASGAAPNLAHLRRQLAEAVPGSLLDDHRAFTERMRKMTNAAMLIGLALLGLMLAATTLLVAFATRGAMATNRAIVEVLHFVGAKQRYIAGQFQRHFLVLGFKGAAIGGGAAMLCFLLLSQIGRAAIPAEQEAGLFTGDLVLASAGYAGIAGVLVLVAAVAAMTSRWTVHRTLNAL